MRELLKRFNSIDVINTYTNPHKVMQHIQEDNPDLIFLDIEMAEMNGVKLAEAVTLLIPEIKIVFVTAHENYAVKAFELHATDYIVKPFSYKRLENTINRLSIGKKSETNTKKTSTYSMIYTFGDLAFASSKNLNERLEVSWRTTKVRGVFIYLLHHRKKLVLKDTLLDLFWPNLELKNGYNQLYSTIYQLRKTIAETNMNMEVSSLDNGYKLCLHDVKLDVDIWEKEIAKYKMITEDNYLPCRSLLDMYSGDYLQYEEYVWLEGDRERLKILWIDLVIKLADYLEHEKNITDSVLLYVLLQSKVPYLENSYFKLMRLYNELGERQSVEKQYEKLATMLNEQYGTPPSQEVLNWYEEWKELHAI